MAGGGRDLRLLAGAVFLSALGDLLAMVTLAVRVHDLTGSSFAVAGYFAASMLPMIVLSPLAGLVADRVESVRVLVVSSLAQAAVAVALAFTADVAGLLALSALLATGAAVSQPAEFRLVPAVAAPGGLTRANGVVETARYVGFAAGPALAGALAAAGGPRTALLVNAASFLAIAVVGGLLHARRPPEPGGAHDRARDGIAALAGDRVLRIVVGPAVAALLVISASLTAEVFYVKDVLGAGDTGYALLLVAWMAGMAAGAMGVAPRVPGRVLGAGALVALGVQGAGMAGQTIVAVLPMALAGYCVGGVGHGVKNTLIRTLIAERVPDRLHGRAFAAYGAARNSAELAALALGGVLVGAIGAREALVVAGAGPMVAALAGLVLLRGVQRSRRPNSAAAAANTAAT
jgi:MFS family permease